MVIFNYSDLSKQSKIGYNAIYNIVLQHLDMAKKGEARFTVPLCLNADNKVSLTEKNFIFFESVLKELKVKGYYNIVEHSGRDVEEVRTNYFTVEIVFVYNSCENFTIPDNLKTFDFSNVDVNKLMKRNGKAEKAKTVINKIAKDEAKAEQEKTSKELEEAKTKVEALKKEVAKKEEQLNKKAIDDFNDDALLSIADCIETLIKKHCKMVPSDFDFSSFEIDLFKAIENKWTIKE